MRKFLIPTLLLALISPSCAAILGIGAGVVISQDMQDSNTFVAQVEEDIDVAWAMVKVSLAKQSKVPLHVDNSLRAAVARIDDADVTVSVEIYDMSQVRLIVSARKMGVTSREIAELVFNRVVQNFAKAQ